MEYRSPYCATDAQVAPKATEETKDCKKNDTSSPSDLPKSCGLSTSENGGSHLPKCQGLSNLVNTPRNGISAFHMRHLSAAKAQTKEEPPSPESKLPMDLQWWLQLRCFHCGFPVTPADRIPVTNPYDPRLKDIQPDRDGKRRDYIRMPYTTCNAHACAPVVEDSDVVFCTNQCELTFMMSSTATASKEKIVDRMNEYVRGRYKITEPTIVAPPARGLAYLQGTGLSRAQFYDLISTLKYQLHITQGNESTPPAPNEAQALEPEFQNVYGKYLNQDLLPASIAASFEVPQVSLDANPDSDTEVDFATGEIFG